jgi:hypothetical protein
LPQGGGHRRREEHELTAQFGEERVGFVRLQGAFRLVIANHFVYYMEKIAVHKQPRVNDA